MFENSTLSSFGRRPPVFLALLLAAAGLVAVDHRDVHTTPVAASYAADTAHRWAGFRIPRNGRADGGWVGGYAIGHTPVFVVTPTRRPNRRGYEPARVVADLNGARGASQGATARAAWVLSKYGGYRDAVQAAAVDAVVHHLLAGGRWRIGRSRGAARIRNTGDPASVLRFAGIMLSQADKFAGVYHVTVSTAAADVGGTIEATVRVSGGHDRPAAGLPVTVSAPGVAAVSAVTGDDGRAVARFPASQRGWQDVTASVGEVPEHRLHLRAPVKRSQATAAEGGVRRTVVATTRAAVRGPQTMALQASPGNLVVGGQAAVTATIAGDGSPRPATAALHGPFASASAAVCTGQPTGSTTTTVTGDGSYRLPAVSPSAGGFYAWRVAVEGTATTLPVTACGAVTKVRGVASTTVLSPDSGSVNQNVQVLVTVSGMPFPAPADVTIALFGPYASPGDRDDDDCGQIAAERVQHVQGNGSFYSPAIQVLEAGYYAWQTSIAPGELWLGSRSQCLAPGTLTTIQ